MLRPGAEAQDDDDEFQSTFMKMVGLLKGGDHEIQRADVAAEGLYEMPQATSGTASGSGPAGGAIAVDNSSAEQRSNAGGPALQRTPMSATSAAPATEFWSC